ncbi:MAG: alkaline phosphatase family protein [Kofleriaceae bacterium]
MPEVWQELRFFPGGAGRIAVAATPLQTATLELELLRPDGSVAAHVALSSGPIGTGYEAQTGELDSSRPWTLRVRGRGAVLMQASFPGAVTTIALAKLGPSAASAIAEAALRVRVDGQILDVSADHSLANLVHDWSKKDISDALGKTTIHGLRTRDLRVTFSPAGVALRIGFEDGAKFSQGAGRSFRVRDAAMTIALGVAVCDGQLELGPVQVDFAADVYDRAALAWLFDVTFGSLRDTVRGKVEAALTAKLASDALRGALGNASRWLCKLLNAQALLDLWIDAEQLSVSTMPMPRRRLVAPAVVAKPAPRWPVEHLVIVMMENRSFTHMLGELVATRPELRVPGITATPLVDAPASAIGLTQQLAIPFDPPHSAEAHAENVAGRWTTPLPAGVSATMRQEVVKYQAIANLPAYQVFAEQFCVATQWRAALSGHTWPNRLYSLSGSSGGAVNNPEGAFEFYDLPTICDVLSAQNVAWSYYKHDVAFLELYRNWTFDHTHIHPFAEFEAAAAQGTLPTVSWVEPNISDFGAGLGSDDHPPISVAAGQQFLQRVYNALHGLTRHTPNWLLVVCYDEHGGFYETVGPVPAPDDVPRCRSTGFRIPAFFVSPLVAPRSTFAFALEHASLIRTILDAYCQPEPIFDGNARVAGARSFVDLVAGATARSLAELPAPFVIPPPSGEEGVEVPRQTSPEWQAFKDRKAELETVVAGQESMAEAPVAAVATLESIYIVATDPAARAAIERELPAWQLVTRPAFDDPRALFAEPVAPVSIERAWNLVHELRARRDVVVVDPLWETELGVPRDGGLETIEAPVDPRWPIELVRAKEAWALPSEHGTSRGAGIVVGHIDTGYTHHEELEDGMILAQYGYDFLAGKVDATDPLVEGLLRFPGHGTATASILASRELGAIAGTAPAAVLIPYRVARTVIHLSMKHMIAAIRRAVSFGCHVISISAGGLWSAALHRAVREARDAGVVVVAAAGNYVPFVVWPAHYDEVIACGACNLGQQRWEWSSRGPAVDITAPGEAVIIAQAGGGTRVSNGTSFATAMVAGSVASWLAFHGRDRLVARYGAHNLTQVVRDLLQRTAQPLQGDTDGMGSGILDLRALLAEPLPDPMLYARFVEEVPDAPVIESISDANELAAQLESTVMPLPLAARQPLADELLFHRALQLADDTGLESVVPAIPDHASAALAAALT